MRKLSFSLFAALLVLAPTAASASQGLEPLPQPADFEQLVTWGMANSPYFTDSALAIDIAKLGETDAALSAIPKLNIHLRYYITSTKETRQYNLLFQSTGINPLRSYLSMEAAEQITELAVQEHLAAIEANIRVIAESIIALHGLKRATKVKAMELDLAKQRVKYAKASRQTTPEDLIETQVSEQEVVVTSSEQDKMILQQQKYLDNLKLVLNLPLDSTLELDMKKAYQQILQGFDPGMITIQDALTHSYQIKKSKISTKLQQKKISLAYARYMPDFYLGVATEDPLYETEKTNDWYLYMGVSFQLWDNMDRYRNINRERLRARQLQTDLKSQKTIEVRNWRQGRLQLNLKEADLNVAREDTKLEAFKEKQKLAQFRANQIKYGILADQSSDHLAAKITEIYREEDYQEALLSLALESGWMLKRFVNQADVKDILR